MAVLVELGVRVPCLSQHRGAVCDLSQMEKTPHGVCMFAGSLWMLLCSVSLSIIRNYFHLVCVINDHMYVTCLFSKIAYYYTSIAQYVHV